MIVNAVSPTNAVQAPTPVSPTPFERTPYDADVLQLAKSGGAVVSINHQDVVKGVATISTTTYRIQSVNPLKATTFDAAFAAAESRTRFRAYGDGAGMGGENWGDTAILQSASGVYYTALLRAGNKGGSYINVDPWTYKTFRKQHEVSVRDAIPLDGMLKAIVGDDTLLDFRGATALR